MAAPDRTLTGTDEVAQAAVDAFCSEVPTIWETMHPLWKRWSLDPNVMGEPNGALLKQGVRTKVHEEVEGADDYRVVVDFLRNTSAGRADQLVSHLTGSLLATNTLMHAHWPPRLYQAWRGVGFQDNLQIQGGAAQFNYITQKGMGNIQSLSRQLALSIYGFGFLTGVDGTAREALQGLALACNATNSALLGSGGATAGEGWYGQINRIDAANADWCGSRTTISAPLQPSNVLNSYMAAQDGNDSPTLMVCGSPVYGIMWNWYEAKQRVLNNNDPTLGRAAPLSFDGVSILRDKTLDLAQLGGSGGGIGTGIFMSSATGATIAEIPTYFSGGLYILNENYIKLVTWKGGAGKGGAPLMLPVLRSTSNLNKVLQAVWLGTLACIHPKRQAMLVSIDV